MKLHWPILKVRIKIDWIFYSQLPLCVTFLWKAPEAVSMKILSIVDYSQFQQ